MAAKLDLPCICLAVIEDSFPAEARALTWQPTDRAAAFRLEALRELLLLRLRRAGKGLPAVAAPLQGHALLARVAR